MRRKVNNPGSMVLSESPRDGKWEPMETNIQSYLSSTVPSLAVYTSANTSKSQQRNDNTLFKSTTSIKSLSTGSLVGKFKLDAVLSYVLLAIFFYRISTKW